MHRDRGSSHLQELRVQRHSGNIHNHARLKSRGWLVALRAKEDLMEMATEEKASSSSSLVPGIEMDKTLGHSVRGKEKLRGEGSVSSGSVVEIQEEMPEHSEGANEELTDGSVLALRADEKGNCSSWVVEMEKLLEDTRPSVEMSPLKMHSIYRVPEWIKCMTNKEAYRPQVVSLGPFHHGEPDLLAMEEHKRRAVLQLVKRAGKPLRDFVAAIEEVADKLQDAYEGLDDKWRGQNRDRFVQMMVMDGCFLLEFNMARAYYPPNDPIFSYHGILTLWPYIRSDMVVIENQLPLLVLQKLVAVKEGTSQSAAQINNMVLGFLDRSSEEGFDELGHHPLGVLHRSLCGHHLEREEWGEWDDYMPSAAELSEAGIHFKVSKTDFINDIDFENGVLSMPLFPADDATETIPLNLLAFEKLHPGTTYQVLSYISFMDNMINTERDVALLRSKGLIENLLSSDMKLAKLVNSLGNGALISPWSKLIDVQRMVNAHCTKRRYRWRASLVHTYFRNPWVFISLLAAVILLVATLLQTVYTVVPFYTKS